VLSLVEQGSPGTCSIGVLPLAEAGAAQKLLEEPTQFGKIVLER